MSIWFHQNVSVEDLIPLGKGTLGETLGMEFIEIGPDFIKASMPVDHRTKQPYGLLHGGASVALAETLGSIGSALITDSSKYLCVGLEINANHLRSVRQGFVYGTAKPIHIGGKTHVWEIRIEDEAQKLICISRLTVAILSRSSV